MSLNSLPGMHSWKPPLSSLREWPQDCDLINQGDNWIFRSCFLSEEDSPTLMQYEPVPFLYTCTKSVGFCRRWDINALETPSLNACHRFSTYASNATFGWLREPQRPVVHMASLLTWYLSSFKLCPHAEHSSFQRIKAQLHLHLFWGCVFFLSIYLGQFM